ncbi:MAG: ABC transporter ATP-binding protein [Candidatus Omnitrophica bacterium]|nr:ABC transporter ATP-binding protein [Candidatus Omnitrophota bacterium]
MSEILLDIRNLSVSVRESQYKKNILSKVNLQVKGQNILGLVGGSGSGKTTIGLSILRLLAPALKTEEGVILFKGNDLLKLSRKDMCPIRGKEISMVFQEPLYAFNPVFRVGDQIEEVLIYHEQMKRKERKGYVLNLLEKVGIPDPKRAMQSYSHQLSGGLRQRAMIAQAIAANPNLIIADEPTSNLDVTRQAQIMDLFRRLKTQLKLSILLVTHDLGMVKHLADEIAVIKDGTVVEQGETRQVFNRPSHLYTCKLLEALS